MWSKRYFAFANHSNVFPNEFSNQEWNHMTGIRAKTTDDWFFEKDKEALFKIASLASLESGHWTIDLEQA